MELLSNLSGAGVAALAINVVVIKLLLKKGVLSQQQVTESLDAAGLFVAEVPPDLAERQSYTDISQSTISATIIASGLELMTWAAL